MGTAIIIPVRYGSTRFPGKPLQLIAGKALVERVWKIAKAVPGVETVVIATDDERIQKFAVSFGAQVIMTSPECKNGSERVYEAAGKLKLAPDHVINFQGDAVLTPPSILAPLVKALNDGNELVTPAVRLKSDQADKVMARGVGKASGTYVTVDLSGRALYFSRYPIPYVRSPNSSKSLLLKHIGVYGYSLPTLKKYVGLAATPLEEAEQLEQLRALEHGIPIKVIEVSCEGRTLCSIDTPQDVAEAESIIAREGELV